MVLTPEAERHKFTLQHNLPATGTVQGNTIVSSHTTFILPLDFGYNSLRDTAWCTKFKEHMGREEEKQV